MSELGPIATVGDVSDFCLPPESGVIADIAAPTLGAKSGCEQLQQGRHSLGHFVGAREQRCGHFESERLSCLQVDDEFELGRLKDRQIGGLLPLKERASPP